MAVTVLSEPDFISRDPAQVVNDIVVSYQDSSGKTLYPAQPERVMIDVIAYRESLLRIAFQEAAKQNLIQYASGAILEHHALMFGLTRLGALKADTTLRFTADNDGRPTPITIPAGTQIRTKDAKQIFVTLEEITLELNDTYLDVEAEALTAGAAANAYPVDTITDPLSSIAWLESVTNTRESEGGADVESDEQLRVRVMQAPETFSVAGSRGAYQFWSLSAHPSIIDVSIDSSLPGRVEVYPLATNGIPSQDVLDSVTEILSDTKVRPLTDTVSVIAPAQVTYSITATVILFTKTPSSGTQNEIESRLEAFTDKQRQRLGRDIVPNQIISIVQGVAGVYNVTLAEPNALVSIGRNEFADCVSITVTLGTPIDEQPIT